MKDTPATSLTRKTRAKVECTSSCDRDFKIQAYRMFHTSYFQGQIPSSEDSVSWSFSSCWRTATVDSLFELFPGDPVTATIADPPSKLETKSRQTHVTCCRIH